MLSNWGPPHKKLLFTCADLKSLKTDAMKNEISLAMVALLTCSAFSARGAAISPLQARTAIAVWLNANPRPLDIALGPQIADIQPISNGKDEPLYYVANLAPSGFVLLAADDRIEPILAFTDQGKYEAHCGNPLEILINVDLRNRMAAVRDELKANKMKSVLRAIEKWTLLTKPWQTATSSRQRHLGVSDIRVSPLIHSQWNQTTVENVACFNYYTPPYLEGSISNYPCGCTATAMAQIMRYYSYPTTAVGMSSHEIMVDAVLEKRNLRGGDGLGGAYVWSLMPLIPDSSITLEQQRAIGALTYDVSVAINSSFSAYGTGTGFSSVYNALLFTFGYGNAVDGTVGVNWHSTISNDDLVRMINPNLDAGYPVMLGIHGDSTPEHAVVCDGYGYDLSTLYHHINLGWSGYSDAWYALPMIEPELSTYYSFVDSCVYNIYTNGSGEIISGRVTDYSGSPIEGVHVTATRLEGGTFMSMTDSRGIYALSQVPSASTFVIAAKKNGYIFKSRSTNTMTSLLFGVDCGNVWGVDFMEQPAENTRLEVSKSQLSSVLCIITFNTTPGRVYDLLTTTNMVSEWSNVPDAGYISIRGTGFPVRYTNYGNDSASRFYKVRSQPE
jgi:hypothetical protein